MHKIRSGIIVAALSLLASHPALSSCGSTFCSANTGWDTQGLTSDEGLRIDFRYSYAKANQLRAGRSKIATPAPSGSDEEIENKRTINQALNVDADYAINSSWNIALGVPLTMRDHTHTFDSSVSAPLTQQAAFTSLGDVRVTGKYKFDTGSMLSGCGIRFGLKLPTGAINQTMTPSNPSEPDTAYALERAAQPGTGSTDAILGMYYFHNLPGKQWGWFASGQFQSAIATRKQYRPGRELTMDAGAYYEITPTLNGLLQLNAHFRQRDSGINANPASGGHTLSVSPGLSYTLTPKTQLYGLLQIALRQYANADPSDPASGQLTAPWSLALGVSQRF